MKNKKKPIIQDITIRDATKDDLQAIICLLADDDLGQKRENTTSFQAYSGAMEEILNNENAQIVVLAYDGSILGVAQINYIHHLTYQGGLRAQIEGVRIDKNVQGQGLGKTLFQELFERAKQRGCHLIQLTTDAKRQKAGQFYESLGFQASHIGMKYHFKTN
jgi:ribosomal protein S18 acetylase RimI-like enzyme